MKILKFIGLGLLVLVLIAAVISFFLPSERHVERSIEINKNPAMVFKQVNNLKTWKNWSYWDNLDPKMESTYEGPEEGVGAKHIWKSHHKQVGNGSMTIISNDPPNSLETELAFEEMVSHGGWTFDKTETGTLATIYMNLELPFMFRIMGLFMDSMLGKDFEATLSNLKKWCESLPDTPSAEWQVEEITVPETNIMSTTTTCNVQQIGQKLGECYGMIGAAMGKQGLTQAGPVLAIYHYFSMDSIVMEPAIPVSKAGKPEGSVTARTTASTKAVKIDYYGAYEGTEQAHDFIDSWLKSNNKTVTGAPWEEYVTDPMNEKDTAKWLTRIYYPVQ